MKHDLLQSISYSQAASLAACEWRWHWRYMLDGEDVPTAAMSRGKALHEAAASWWAGGDAAYDDEGLDDEVASAVDWLMDRYTDHYAALRDETTVIAQEVELEADLAGVGVVGRLDGIFEIGGMKWAVERKTYSSRDRLSLLTVDPQITLYTALAQANGYSVDGVLWDGIYTYQWKSPRPPAESFDLVYLDRTQEQITLAVEHWLRPIAERRKQLVLGYEEPIRNFGWQCKTCPARQACHDSVSFDDSQVLD